MSQKQHTDLPRNMKGIPRSYLHLLVRFPLRPIDSESQYQEAVKLVHELALRGEKLDSSEAAYLEVLESVVERYERESTTFDADSVSPTDALRALVKSAGMAVTELGRLIGSKSAASELISGKPIEPSKRQIARLCARFKVDAGLFLRPAKLSTNAA